MGLNKDRICICPGDLTPFIEMSVLWTILYNATLVINQESVYTQAYFWTLLCSTDPFVYACIDNSILTSTVLTINLGIYYTKFPNIFVLQNCFEFFWLCIAILILESVVNFHKNSNSKLRAFISKSALLHSELQFLFP